MREDGVDLRGTGLLQLLRRVADRPAGVGHVVHQNGNAIVDVADEDHRGDLVGAFSFLVNERKVDIEAVGDGGDALGAAGVG